MRCRCSGSLIHRPSRRDRPDAFDAVLPDADIPVVEVDGRVAMAGDELYLVAELQAIGGGGDAEPARLVGGALLGRGPLRPPRRRALVPGGPPGARRDDW